MNRTALQWYARMRKRRTIECDGYWLLKLSTSDTEMWINEINKKRIAKRRRLIRGVWVVESYLLRDRGWVQTDRFTELEGNQ